MCGIHNIVVTRASLIVTESFVFIPLKDKHGRTASCMHQERTKSSHPYLLVEWCCGTQINRYCAEAVHTIWCPNPHPHPTPNADDFCYKKLCYARIPPNTTLQPLTIPRASSLQPKSRSIHIFGALKDAYCRLFTTTPRRANGVMPRQNQA
ncbi:hypothetical protein AVEN_22826-1 [Araneus ventricosus]|uniref:Uncharacterized protein n=1 Tax=Araneus ventricosus TaxID=182803 RepID=A0A4Y2M9U3_ARAVE|nr:hypothetical protein AVEN_22826-1 [Araneus ventricosus]